MSIIKTRTDQTFWEWRKMEKDKREGQLRMSQSESRKTELERIEERKLQQAAVKEGRYSEDWDEIQRKKLIEMLGG